MGNCNGTISVSPSGGLSPYEFEWMDANQIPIPGEKDSLIENLCSGKYFINVKDASGCLGIDSVIILEPEELLAAIDVGEKTCFGECDGQIKISISGGIEPYDIVWKDKDGLVIGTTDSLSKLCAGKYTSTIKDSNLCVKSIGPIFIEEFEEIEATFKIDSALCTKDDGEIAVIPIGTDSFKYQWFNNLMVPLGTDSVESNLVSGVYHVSLTSKTTSCSKLFSVTMSNSGSPKLQNRIP